MEFLIGLSPKITVAIIIIVALLIISFYIFLYKKCKEHGEALLWATLAVVLLIGAYSALISDERSVNHNKEYQDYGVVVHGYDNEEGWIKNTNQFPVRIKKVFIYKAEETLWIKKLNPGQIIKDNVHGNHRYYIYDNSAEVGFIIPK
jgi:hypothetical protein